MNTLSYKTISVNKETAKKEWVVIDATDQVVGRLCSKVAKLIRVTDYSCQRCLQFMGKCGNKIFSGSDFIFQILNILLQRFCHMVEIRGQLSHFIITDLLRAIAVFSLRHFAGGTGQKSDRSGQPTGNQRHDRSTA